MQSSMSNPRVSIIFFFEKTKGWRRWPKVAARQLHLTVSLHQVLLPVLTSAMEPASILHRNVSGGLSVTCAPDPSNEGFDGMVSVFATFLWIQEQLLSNFLCLPPNPNFRLLHSFVFKNTKLVAPLFRFQHCLVFSDTITLV